MRLHKDSEFSYQWEFKPNTAHSFSNNREYLEIVLRTVLVKYFMPSFKDVLLKGYSKLSGKLDALSEREKLKIKGHVQLEIPYHETQTRCIYRI